MREREAIVAVHQAGPDEVLRQIHNLGRGGIAKFVPMALNVLDRRMSLLIDL